MQPASQLQYLIDMCIGKVHKAMKSCALISPPAEGLRRALNLLYENFGQRHVVVKDHLDAVCKGPPVKHEKESLSDLASDMMNCQITMQSWGFDAELNSP